MQTAKASTRKVGSGIDVLDNMSSQENPTFLYVGKIVKITKHYVSVQYLTESITKFHRESGFCVGYHWPYLTTVIAPEQQY